MKESNAGKDIVGTTHNSTRPTQDSVNPEKVQEYATKLQNGEKVDPIEVYDTGNARYLQEGHHQYVASQMTGIPVEVRVQKGGGPVGFPNWSEVQWKDYVTEDEWWR